MKNLVSSFILFQAIVFSLAAFCSNANAHFIWVAKAKDTGKIQVFFGEGPHPDSAKFLKGIEHIKVWSLDGDKDAALLKTLMKKEGDNGWLECQSDSAPVSVDAHCAYGVFGRGDKKMFLDYSCKYADFKLGDSLKSAGKLPLDIAVSSADDEITFHVNFKGKAAADCEVQIFDDKGESASLKTDDKGKAVFKNAKSQRYMVRAKVVEDSPGELDGEKYDDKRFYCTMVLGTESEMKQAASNDTFKTKRLTDLPVGITSFGAAMAGDSLYVFGGHCGEAHEYCESGQNKGLYALDMKSNKWQHVADTVGLQGLAMVAHDNKLYRVGGFHARNKEDEKQDLHSTAEFARFDEQTKKWEQLEPMPQPRSSCDAVVVDDTLFVVGGWSMAGDAEKKWLDTACKIDLSSKDAKWKKVSVPFKRRALSVGHVDGSLVVIGGMQQKGGPTSKVAFYDIKKESWSEGPGLPGSGSMEGFGSSCFNVGGRLIASTYSGVVLKLSKDQKSWEKIGDLAPGRFFHRLVAVSDREAVVVGGANMSIGKCQEVEVFDVKK